MVSLATIALGKRELNRVFTRTVREIQFVLSGKRVNPCETMTGGIPSDIHTDQRPSSSTPVLVKNVPVISQSLFGIRFVLLALSWLNASSIPASANGIAEFHADERVMAVRALLTSTR